MVLIYRWNSAVFLRWMVLKEVEERFNRQQLGILLLLQLDRWEY